MPTHLREGCRLNTDCSVVNEHEDQSRKNPGGLSASSLAVWASVPKKVSHRRQDAEVAARPTGVGPASKPTARSQTRTSATSTLHKRDRVRVVGISDPVRLYGVFHTRKAVDAAEELIAKLLTLSPGTYGLGGQRPGGDTSSTCSPTSQKTTRQSTTSSGAIRLRAVRCRATMTSATSLMA